MKRGWRAISEIGRPGFAVTCAGGIGILTSISTAAETSATADWARKVPAKRYGCQRSLVPMTSCEPNSPAKMPPTITQEIAFGRNSSLAVSAAAKR